MQVEFQARVKTPITSLSKEDMALTAEQSSKPSKPGEKLKRPLNRIPS